MTKNKAPEAPKKPYDIVVGSVMDRIASLQNTEQIHLPGDYSPQNALQSAWLILQETKSSKESGYKLVLDHCTRASIANSLFDMIVSGLNPAKDQGYFIAYGTRLAWVQSYFGAMTVAKRVDPRIADDGIIAEVKYEDDVLEWEIVRGRKIITKHFQTSETIKGDIESAYCQIIDGNGEIIKTEIMTFEEIKESWRRSKSKPIDKDGNLKPDSNHAQHPVEFSKRTIINRTCKPIINSSSDKVLLASVNRREFTEAAESSDLQIEEKANKDFVDIESQSTESTKASDDTEKDDDSDKDGKPTDEELAEAEKEEKIWGGDDDKWMGE